MEARIRTVSLAILSICALAEVASAQLVQRSVQQHVAQSQNFIVFAPSPQSAAEVAKVAEQHRQELALHWLGKELPAWPQRCPIHVNSGPFGAQGETRYSLLPGGTAGDWAMTVTGTPERILDSVLPHEITHTIFATHFAALGKYVPRWADEGACTTVEHDVEKRKHREHLDRFLKSGRGLAFNTMFKLKEYPQDILPLYAQGHSAVQFLIDQGGAQKFVQFLEAGMRTERWAEELRSFYEYKSIGDFQVSWNQWLYDGSPTDLTAYAPGLRANAVSASLASADISRPSTAAANQHVENAKPSPFQFAIGDTEPTPARLASDPIALNAPVQARSNAGADAERGMPVDSEGWYKRRLIEVSGSPASPVPEHNTVAKNSLRATPLLAGPDSPFGSSPAIARGAPSGLRPAPSGNAGIQVLDWGNGGPVPGIQSPIYR
ncbi:MAG: hypothetical protein R3C53_07760 [Pirellulaceae bacterium]